MDVRLNDEGEDNIDEEDVELINNCFTVDFGDQKVTFKKDELEKFTLAYAMTVHKSQGSEYDYVVLVMANVNFLMLKRNLLYTGVTRAKKLLCMVGQKRSVACAVRNVSVDTRKTKLKERIQKYCREEEKQTA